MAERICVAQIGAAHGVRGEVRLKSFTVDPMAVMDYGPLETEDGSAHVAIEAMRPAKDHLVARLAGIHDRDAAERLRNVKLFIPRERLPSLETDEFYHADLVGLVAVTADGRAFGTVIAVHNFGAGDLLEIRSADSAMTIMLPFNETSVPQIDIAGGKMVVQPPARSPDEQPGGE